MAAAVGKSGAAYGAAKAQLGMFDKAIEASSNMISDVQLDIGKAITPIATSIVDVFTKVTPKAIDTAVESFKLLSGKISNLSDDVSNGNWQGIGSKIGKALSTAISTAFSAGSGIAKSFSSLISSVDWVAVGANTITDVMPKLAIGLLVGLGNLDIIEDVLKPIGDNIVGILLGVLSVGLAPAKMLAPLAKIISKIPFADAIVGSVTRAIRGALLPIRNAFGGLFSSAVDGSKKIIFVLFELVKGVLDNILGYVTGFGPGLVSSVKLMFTGLVDDTAAIISNIPRIFAATVDGIRAPFMPIAAWFREKYNSIIEIFAPITNWFGDKFTEAWGAITGAFGNVAGFFSGLWNTVTSTFSKVGTSIGDAIGNAFKNAINAMLGFIEGKLNNIVDVINGAIKAIDDITPGGLPRIGRFAIPRLAEGGIVMNRPGGILANIGEGREPEAVIPLSKIDKITNNSGGNVTINLNMSGIMARSKSDERAIAKSLIARINEELRAKNKPVLGGGAI
jgi:phage-related protein